MGSIRPNPPVYVISGGTGASGEQLVQTVLAQFPGQQVPVVIVSNVRQIEQIEAAIAQAQSSQGVAVHTLVDARLRAATTDLAQQHAVAAVDLMGPLLGHLTEVLGQEPAGHPGLYRKLNRAYFERVAAIEYTMAHDDGKNPQEWPQADVLLLGVSRAGKTPLSLYLSVLGWKAANYPVVKGLSIPSELFTLDRRRVIGLYIEAGQLLLHRQQRQSRLGAPGPTAYTDPEAVYEEVELARQLFQRNGFRLLDVTDKPIESCADEVIRWIAPLAEEK